MAHNIIFQAEHQRFYHFDPLLWFVHFRARGDAQQIARGVKAALNVTSTQFPQTMPKNPTTPLPAEELGDILGAKPTIGANGVVTFDIPRDDAIIWRHSHQSVLERYDAGCIRIKTGNALELAREIRAGLNLMDMKFERV